MKDVIIGTAVARNGLFLAPMAGFTDAPFRALCRLYGATYTVSEMISAAAMHFGDRKTASLARLPEGDTPTAIQIFGHSPEFMAEAAFSLLSGDYPGCEYAQKPCAIDINMGCPVKKIVSSGDGSALMRSPELCAEITEAVCRSADRFSIPVTVKIRLGFNEINAPEVALACVRAGAHAVFVHGRTRNQMYSGSASADGIARVREALPPDIPVIANGDVKDRESAESLLHRTGCDGLMIGRGALGAPWIFREITDPDFVPPDDAEKRMIALRLIRDIVAIHGEHVGIPMSRCRAGHFLAGMKGAAAMRSALNSAVTLREAEDILIGECQ